MNKICIPKIAIWIPRYVSHQFLAYYRCFPKEIIVNTLSEKWALENCLIISMNKTVSMNLSSRQNMHGFCFEFDELFQFVKETTEIHWLDLWQQNVLWTSYWIIQSKHPMNILKVLSRSKWGADRTTLLKICRSLKRSNWDYGCIVYGPAPKHHWLS